MLAVAALVALVPLACAAEAEPSPELPEELDLALEARNIAFSPDSLQMVAGPNLVVSFDNADGGVPHGLVLYGGARFAIKVAEAPIVIGPDHRRFEIGLIVPGLYRFSCQIHPNMQADLLVLPG